jgi:hypothetical protein
MAGLCITIGNFAGIFLLLAAIVAVIETALLMLAKWKALKQGPAGQANVADANTEGLATVITALKELLLALKDLPAWFALFLAALALIWTANAATKLCVAANPPTAAEKPAPKPATKPAPKPAPNNTP